MKDFNTTATEIGKLVTEKNIAYGDAFGKCGEFLRLLYPQGIQPPQYDDALAMVRIFDKQMRVATRKDAFGESPYRDIAGYGILGAVKDSTPLPAGEGSDPLVKDATAESLCHTCHRNKGCIGGYPRTKDGGCEGYRLPPITVPPPASLRERILDAKQEAKPSLCHSCHIPKCDKPLIERCEMEGVCAQYVPEAKQEAPTAAEQPLDFTLPSIALKCTAEEAKEKYHSEIDEYACTEDGSIEELVERWDCLQAVQTFYERGGSIKFYQDHARSIMEDLTMWFAKDRAVVEAKAAMLLKNAQRGYYSPEVNAEVIASNGGYFTPKGRKP